MGRTNHSYNGMLSAIARKSLPRFTNYAKDTASLSTIFGNEYSTINKRGNDSLTNIISVDFDTPEEYIKETNVGPIITLNGDRTVTMVAETDYTDLGATADGGEEVTVDTSNLDSNAVGTYTVSYSATDTAGYTRVENRFVNVTRGLDRDGISSWDLKSTLSDPSGLDAGFAYQSASISGDGTWISVGSEDKHPNNAYPVGFGNVFMYTKNTDITWSETQTISNPTPDEYLFGKRTKLSRDGNYLYACTELKSYLFKRTNNTWNSTTAIIDLSDQIVKIALSEDGTYVAYIVIRYNLETGEDNFETQIYKKSSDDTSMVYLETIASPPDQSWTYIDISISDAADMLCVGSPLENSLSGNVYVYTRDDENWSSSTYTVIQAPDIGKVFGYSVSISGDGNYIAIGAPIGEAVYITKKTGSSWSSLTEISGPSSSSYAFGAVVSLSQNADYLVVGTLYDGSYIGNHAYIYSRSSDDSWTLKQTLTEGAVGSGFGRDVHISSTGNYILVTASRATANAYVFYGEGGAGPWVPGYATVSVTLGDKLQPNVSSLTRGQKYVFDFSRTRGKEFRLSLDGTTELTDGVIEAENTLVYTVPSDFDGTLYYYSPNTPNIGGSFLVI